MLESFSSNAISAKIKAMYGRRITNEQYNVLMHKKTVAQAAAYLKEETSYSDVLSTMVPGTIHRGQLENLISKKKFMRYVNLIKYSASGKSYYDYIVREAEIEQILQMIRLLNMGKGDEYITQYPSFVDRITDLSFLSLAKVRNFDELLEVLVHTPYAKILREMKPADGDVIDYTLCETALRTFFYNYQCDIIDSDKHMSKKAKKQLRNLLDTHTELINVNSILRLKRFFPEVTPEGAYMYILPVKGRIPERFWRELCSVKSAEDVLELMHTSSYAKYIDDEENLFLEYNINKICYYICRKYLSYSTEAEVVFSAYMVLSQIEISNITVIIEGIRYGMEPEEISKMIIY